MRYFYLGLIIFLFVLLMILFIVYNERKNKKLNLEKEKINKKNFLDRMVKASITAALAYLLYYLKFPLPFFPSFLEINFSMFPIILLGFMYGPWWASAVVLVRFVLKIPFTHTAYVGELADLLIGLMVVIPSSLFYQYNKTKKGGILSLTIGAFFWVLAGVITNYFINVPFYVKAYFGGELEGLVNMLKPLYKDINNDNFMFYYLLLGIVPFNLLLSVVTSIITFFVYKTVSKIFKKDFFRRNKRKILVASDSFKGSMSSLVVGKTITNILDEKGYESRCIAVSDGGEGFLDSLSLNFENAYFVEANSCDALGRERISKYLVDEKNKKAYFELAIACGITTIGEDELNPFKASSKGLGLLIKDAVEKFDIKEIYIGIGGSASNDGGSGLLEALGVKFYDENDQIIEGLCNELLPSIKRIDTSLLDEVYEDIKFVLLCDVENELLGPNGATYVYAPQKGASADDLVLLEQNMKYYSDIVISSLGINNIHTNGSGAAGGCGFGIMSFLKATKHSGIDFILDNVHFDELVNEYDEVITGEGKFDNQSLQGKVISGIMSHHPKKLTIVCGMVDDKVSISNEYQIYSIVPNIMSKEESIQNPIKALEELIKKHY